MLADRQIRDAVCSADVHGQGRYSGLDIQPYDDKYLNPASYDLTLAPILRMFNEPILDVADVVPHTFPYDMSQAGDCYTLRPGDFLLAATNEVVTLPDTLVGRVEGKSSLGRLGMLTHVTAGFIDPGFVGSITLEIKNVSDHSLVIRTGMRVCQIAFTPMCEPPWKPYGEVGHYQDQPPGEPVESRYRMDPK